MIAEIKNGFAGYFQIEKHQVDDDGLEIPGSREVIAPWFPNLITDGGLDMLASPDSSQYVQLGTSNVTPAFTNTALGNRIAGVIRNNIAAGPSGADYVSCVQTYVFAQGAVVGIIAEIGTSQASASSALFSRALILDGNGDPTTLNITAIDVLTVTYQVRLYPSQADVVATHGIYTTTTRVFAGLDSDRVVVWLGSTGLQGNPTFNQATTHNGAMAPWNATTVPSASGGTSHNYVVQPYTAGNHYRDASWHFPVANGNAAAPGITVIALAGTGGGGTRAPWRHQVGFSPAIAKNNTRTLDIVSRVSWGRYSP